MESLELSLGEINPPWREKIRSLLVEPHQDTFRKGELCNGFGMVSSMTMDWLNFEVGFFEPFRGLALTTPTQTGVISFEGLTFPVIPPKSWIGFSDGLVGSTAPLTIQMSDKSALWFIPEFCPGLAISACHLFAGAFCGWERALQWLQTQSLAFIDTTVAVDCDETVMKVWNLQQSFDHSLPKMHFGGVSLTNVIEKKNGAVQHIGNFSWMNLCRVVPNLVFTLSPPCQTWSAGGRLGGFEHPNGFAMAEGIESIKRVRPVVVCLECSDNILKHPHYELVKKLLMFSGYRQVWSSSNTLHNLAAMFRTRWLAVWVRCDVASFPSQFISTFGNVNSVKWDHQMYDFTLPDQLVHQLKLGTKLCEV